MMNESGTKQEIPMSFNLDDFYTTQEQRDDEKKEKIEEINIELIDNFKNHPFKVLDNEELKSLEEKIEIATTEILKELEQKRENSPKIYHK